MEIVVSALFILKLFLNVYLTTERSRWRVIASYLAPLAALGISAGVGIGQIIFCKLNYVDMRSSSLLTVLL